MWLTIEADAADEWAEEAEESAPRSHFVLTWARTVADCFGPLGDRGVPPDLYDSIQREAVRPREEHVFISFVMIGLKYGSVREASGHVAIALDFFRAGRLAWYNSFAG